MTTTPNTDNLSGARQRKLHLLSSTVVTKVIDLDKGGRSRLFARWGEFIAYVMDGITRFAAKTPDYGTARSILGDNFITAEEIMAKRPDIVYSPVMLAMLASTIPSAETLGALKARGLGLMPHPPEKVALLAIRTAKPEHFYSKTGGWYEPVKFATSDLTGSGWFAHKLTPAEGSLNRNWDEQNQLLPATDYVPNAAETSWFITIFFDVRGVRLFENVYVRTSSLDSDGHRVSIGGFDARGLSVNDGWDNGRFSDLGLASAWKF